MRSLLRIAYRILVRMHPASFRTEFGEEMLWIFDEESRRGATLTLLLDGIRSVAVQHARPLNAETIDSHAYRAYREVNSAPPVFRFAQAGLIVLSGAFFLSLLFSPLIPKLATADYGAAGRGKWLLTQIKTFASLPHAKSAKI